jgi:hypothetical protein
LTLTGFLAEFWEPICPEGGTLLMDVYGIEVLLGLPEYRVVNQVLLAVCESGGKPLI